MSTGVVSQPSRDLPIGNEASNATYGTPQKIARTGTIRNSLAIPMPRGPPPGRGRPMPSRGFAPTGLPPGAVSGRGPPPGPPSQRRPSMMGGRGPPPQGHPNMMGGRGPPPQGHPNMMGGRGPPPQGHPSIMGGRGPPPQRRSSMMGGRGPPSQGRSSMIGQGPPNIMGGRGPPPPGMIAGRGPSPRGQPMGGRGPPIGGRGPHGIMGGRGPPHLMAGRGQQNGGPYNMMAGRGPLPNGYPGISAGPRQNSMVGRRASFGAPQNWNTQSINGPSSGSISSAPSSYAGEPRSLNSRRASTSSIGPPGSMNSIPSVVDSYQNATSVGTRRIPGSSDINESSSQGNVLRAPPSNLSTYTPNNIQSMSFETNGCLKIKCLKATGLSSSNESSIFTKADPYVKFIIGEKEFKTKTKVRAGAEAVWDEEFSFDLVDEKEVHIEVLDKEMVGKDKTMGKTTVSLLDWISNGHFSGDINLFSDTGEQTGTLKLEANFKRSNEERVQGYDGAEYADKSNQQQYTDEQIVEAFRAFDLDNNNFVGAAEIRHVLVNIGERVTDEEIDEMIRMVDKDGDGQVSFDEFYKMITGQKPSRDLLANFNRDRRSTTTAPPPPTGPAVMQARNAKRKALDEFARDCNLKPESIKRAYRRFMASKNNKSGVIDYTEFCVILQVEPTKQCEDLFQLYDYDNIGMIDTRELLVGLANFTGAGKDDKLKFSFMMYDEEGNGVITKHELIQILKANHMAKSDAEVARKADTIMAQADKKGDGVIVYDDYVEVSRKFPNILFPAQRMQNTDSPNRIS